METEETNKQGTAIAADAAMMGMGDPNITPEKLRQLRERGEKKEAERLAAEKKAQEKLKVFYLAFATIKEKLPKEYQTMLEYLNGYYESQIRPPEEFVRIIGSEGEGGSKIDSTYVASLGGARFAINNIMEFIKSSDDQIVAMRKKEESEKKEE